MNRIRQTTGRLSSGQTHGRFGVGKNQFAGESSVDPCLQFHRLRGRCCSQTDRHGNAAIRSSKDRILAFAVPSVPPSERSRWRLGVPAMRSDFKLIAEPTSPRVESRDQISFPCWADRDNGFNQQPTTNNHNIMCLPFNASPKIHKIVNCFDKRGARRL
jgi:hypothetical protein